jgi:DNA-binding IclR family transcriptional regulator
LGKVLLAGHDRARVLEILQDQGLARQTARTITSARELFSELDFVRERGYATVKDEHYVGFWSIAAPILDAEGVTRAAVSLTGSPDQPVWRDPDTLSVRLAEAARDISRSMRLR